MMTGRELKEALARQKEKNREERLQAKRQRAREVEQRRVERDLKRGITPEDRARMNAEEQQLIDEENRRHAEAGRRRRAQEEAERAKRPLEVKHTYILTNEERAALLKVTQLVHNSGELGEVGELACSAAVNKLKHSVRLDQ